MIVLIWKFHIGFREVSQVQNKNILIFNHVVFLWASSLLTTSLKWIAKKKGINKWGYKISAHRGLWRKGYRGGRGGRDGKEVWGRRPVETFQSKYLIWLLQSVKLEGQWTAISVCKGVCNMLTWTKETSWLRKKGQRNYSREGATQKAYFHHHTILQRKGNVFPNCSSDFWQFIVTYLSDSNGFLCWFNLNLWVFRTSLVRTKLPVGITSLGTSLSPSKASLLIAICVCLGALYMQNICMHMYRVQFY